MNLKISAFALIGLAACSPGSVNNPDGGDPGNDGGPNPDAGTIVTLDPSAMEIAPIAMAIGSSNQVGVAYFKNVAPTITDAGQQIANYEIRYLEWQSGAVTIPSEKIQTVQRVSGVSVAFQNSGRPAATYLGGDSKGSLYWLQSNVAISYRQTNGSWTEEIAVRYSNEAICGNPVSDVGNVVGLHPAIAFDGGTTYVAYRDVHFGEFPVGDWDGSDLELVYGSPGAWTHAPVICGGNDKLAWGGHNQMLMVQGQPAIVSDQLFDSETALGVNVNFTWRRSDGTWISKLPVMQIANTQVGPSFAYDSTLGFAVAAVDRSSDTLFFSSSHDGIQWTVKDPAYQSGTGGWYPSVAVDPSTHEPSIAYYFCSSTPGVSEGNCPATQNELRIAARVLGNWRNIRIDSQGGVLPKLGFLSTGKRVIVYRHPQSGALKLYVDR